LQHLGSQVCPDFFKLVPIPPRRKGKVLFVEYLMASYRLTSHFHQDHCFFS